MTYKMLLQVLYEAIAASRFGQYFIAFHCEHCMIVAIYIVGCDDIKVTMAAEEDDTSLT